jgi:hypothetical protein
LLTADIEETYASTAITLLANISYRLKREVRFDSATHRITGDEEANAMLVGTYRAPFTVPEAV